MEREKFIPFSGDSLRLPCFFSSISSVKTNLSFIDYLRVLSATGFPSILISAYDLGQLAPEQLNMAFQILGRCQENGQFILMDSGNYESYWHSDQSWEQASFFSILERSSVPVAFSFDGTTPPAAVSDSVSSAIDATVAAQELSSVTSIVPIVHGRNFLVEACAEVARNLTPLAIAVPERELGDGLLERAQRVTEIRHALDQLGTYIPLHLLGTGNPLAQVIYAACGADSFDGLEWCQTSVDPPSALLHHFHESDFLFERGALSND